MTASKAPFSEGKAPCVGFHQTDVGQALVLVLGHLQHAMGKIHANNLAIRSDLCLHVGEKRTRTGAEVENRTSVLYGNLVNQKLPGQALLVAGMKSDKAIIEPRKLVVVSPSPASHESSLAAKRLLDTTCATSVTVSSMRLLSDCGH